MAPQRFILINRQDYKLPMFYIFENDIDGKYRFTLHKKENGKPSGSLFCGTANMCKDYFRKNFKPHNSAKTKWHKSNKEY